MGRERKSSDGQRKGTFAMQSKYRQLRADAYAQGVAEWDELIEVPTFRDFIVLSIAEGYKRSLRQLSTRTPVVTVQYHRDQSEHELRTFWGEVLAVEPDRLQPWIDRIHESWG